MALIFPSLISANLLNLESDIKLLENHCDGFHLDIMDFHFVPNLTWGPDFVNAIRKITKKQLYIHLMVDYPEKYFERFEINKNDIVSVHIESPTTVPFSQIIYDIKSYGWIPSIAINPFTPLEAIISCNAPFENVLLMSVNPGFSGQKFLPHSIDRLKALNNLRSAHKLNFTIAVDGGINSTNSKQLISNGADQIIAASAIFNFKDKIQAIKELV